MEEIWGSSKPKTTKRALARRSLVPGAGGFHVRIQRQRIIWSSLSVPLATFFTVSCFTQASISLFFACWNSWRSASPKSFHCTSTLCFLAPVAINDHSKSSGDSLTKHSSTILGGPSSRDISQTPTPCCGTSQSSPNKRSPSSGTGVSIGALKSSPSSGVSGLSSKRDGHGETDDGAADGKISPSG